ncbi:MAG: hypothetical protein GY832_17100 [Chloroflexi bacterium]|nr:hypothetical protein [Chloroflexota bacterium]
MVEIAYRDAVEPNIADLLYEKAECERLAETEGKLRDAQEQLPCLVNDGKYAEAKELYDEVLLLTRGKAEARRALDDVFAPVRGLESLSQARQRSDTSPQELVKQARDMIIRFPDHIAVRQEIKRVLDVLLPELEQRAQEARFIEDIDDALNLGQALQSLCQSAQVAQDTLERYWQAVADLKKKRGAFKQSVEKIVAEFKGEVSSQQMVQAQQKVDKLKELAKLGSNYQRSVDKLPDVDELGSQVAERNRLMVEASLQNHLNVAMGALRSFRPDFAQHALDRISGIASRMPDLVDAYRDEIDLVRKEYQTQRGWTNQTLQKLSTWRMKKLQDRQLMPKEIKSLEDIWLKTFSISVSELWSLVQPEQAQVKERSLITKRYERAQAEMHKGLLGLLKNRQVDNLQPRLDQFDRIWRKELGKNSTLRIQLDGFVNAWNERITQAQNLGDEIHDLKILINSTNDRYQSRVQALKLGQGMFDRIGTVLVYTLPEVFFVFSKECHHLLRRLAAVLEVGKINLSDKQVEYAFQDTTISDWPIWKRIENQAARGKRFFAILEEETAPRGG